MTSTSPHRIVVIGNGNGMGGAQKAFHCLCSHLLDEAILAGVVSIGTFPGRKLKDSQHWSIELPYAARTFKMLRSKLWGAARASHLIRKTQPTIVFSVGIGKTPAFLFKHAPRSAFCCAQDFIHDRDLKDPLLALTSRHADALVTQTDTMAQRFRRDGFTSKPLSWLPCFTEPPEASVQRTKPSDDRLCRLSYFGRIASNKGLPLLLQAIAEIRSENPITLDIWGGGELEDTNKSIRALGLEGTVTVCGRYPEGPDGARLMASYDGLALTSTHNEGLPLVLLEAMAYGVPLLVTDVGSMAEVAQGNPDALLASPTLDSVKTQLIEFATRSRSGGFNSARQIRFYNSHFSTQAFKKRWQDFLADPVEFFS